MTIYENKNEESFMLTFTTLMYKYSEMLEIIQIIHEICL